mmetsp:Transcript_30649/g.77549  ORF Transcript_30649/g.77549 Transcript_30649/m.77549 type:complete len:297 (-) Transcript_30649:105-995(-)
MADTVMAGKVHIKVVRADDLRQHLNRKPAPMAMLRVSVAGVAQQELMKTDPMPSSSSPEWNQEFVLPVSDASQSQLECTIWDTSDPQPTEFSNFLGEVLLNLAKLIPYKGHYIEQVFFVKQGKTIKTEQQATGNLKLGLRLDISEQPRSPGAGAGVKEEEAAGEDAAAREAAAREQERERAAREEQERRAREAEEAAERAARQAAEARRQAEAERARADAEAAARQRVEVELVQQRADAEIARVRAEAAAELELAKVKAEAEVAKIRMEAEKQQMQRELERARGGNGVQSACCSVQ